MFSPPLMLIALLGAHFLFDYPLQGDFLSKGKNRFTPIPGVPWYQAMIAHCFMHGAVVSLITGIWWLGVAEFIIHFYADDTKCMGKLTFNQDQAIHLFCKLFWFCITVFLLHHA